MIIMAKEKNYMPQSSAGLIRYYDTEGKGISLSPKTIVAMAAGFSAFVIVLNLIAI